VEPVETPAKPAVSEAPSRPSGPAAEPEVAVAPRVQPTAPLDPVVHGPQTAAGRRAQTIASLSDLPELQASVSTGIKYSTVGDLAEIPPEVLRQRWQEHRKYLGRKPKGKTAMSFEEYVTNRSIRNDKALLGERNDAFARGKSEVILKAPKDAPGSSGIDSISYNKTSDRIKLLDNKAYSDTVPDASALQRNLAKNLKTSTEELRILAGTSDAPPELKRVLPRMEDASNEVGEHVKKFLAANKHRQLKKQVLLGDAQLQAELGAILDRHGIDRVITFEASAPGVGISSGMRQQGFKTE
jgi:hypothetical protein